MYEKDDKMYEQILKMYETRTLELHRTVLTWEKVAGVRTVLSAKRVCLFVTYPLGGGYVLFSPLFLTALSLSQSVISYLLFGITRPLLERE